MNFPRYNYEDMVRAQHRLITQGLGLQHLRAVIGYSMGGMQTWLWGSRYPGFADALVPMASTPAAMSGRNWMLRRMLTQSIRNDPDWQEGNYSIQPRGMQAHLLYFSLATSGGSLGWYGQAPSSSVGDQLIATALAQPFSGDANDLLYQWEAGFDFDPGPGLERIEAALLAINSADDERNPPELGLMQREISRVRNGQYLLIPGSPATCGHASALRAGLYKDRLAELLQQAPRSGG
jgi:homoserine O-acetyltransferase